jgi:hypothetical protein
MPIVQLLIALLIFALAWWIVQRVIIAFKIGEPVQTVILIVFVLVVMLWLISVLRVVTP